MNRFGVAGIKLAKAIAACVAATVMLSAASARADVVFYDKDGWAVYTRGLIASHYQYAFGDGDPSTTHGVVVGGKIAAGGAEDPRGECTPTTTLDAAGNPVAGETCKPTLNLSRLRSGFIGTQLGLGVRRRINDQVNVDSLIAINLADISSNRAQESNKSVDVREAWAAVNTPYGTFKMGRMFMIFGSGSAPVVLISHQYSVGNPCFVNSPTIACASVGAGPLYAAFDAQLRYETPRFAGLQLQVAAADPWVAPTIQMTPLPRFDMELNYDQKFTESVRLRVFAQGVFQQLERRDQMNELVKQTVMGGMGTAVLNAGGLAVGGGAWQCRGCGTRKVMEIGESANPLAHDGKYTLRTARGFFANAGYTMFGYTLAAGGGAAFVKPTVVDAPELAIDPATGVLGIPNTGYSILKQSIAYHVTFRKQIDAIILSAEYMHWKNTWHYEEKQDQTYTGVGANYTW